MKKDSILVRVIAVLLAINFCFGLVWVAVFGAIKPMAISLVKNVVADEIIESASDRVDANMENNETEKKISFNKQKTYNKESFCIEQSKIILLFSTGSHLSSLTSQTSHTLFSPLSTHST